MLELSANDAHIRLRSIYLTLYFSGSETHLEPYICGILLEERHYYWVKLHGNNRFHAHSNAFRVRKRAKIRNRYNQAPHLTQDTNGKVTKSQSDSFYHRYKEHESWPDCSLGGCLIRAHTVSHFSYAPPFRAHIF